MTRTCRTVVAWSRPHQESIQKAAKVGSVNAPQAPLCCDRISLSTWAKELCKCSWRNWAEVARQSFKQRKCPKMLKCHPIRGSLNLPRALEAFRVGVAVPAMRAICQDANTTLKHIQRTKMRVRHDSSCSRWRLLHVETTRECNISILLRHQCCLLSLLDCLQRFHLQISRS